MPERVDPLRIIPRVIVWRAGEAPHLASLRWDLAEALELRGFDFTYDMDVVDAVTLRLPLPPDDVDLAAYGQALRELLADHPPALIRDAVRFVVRFPLHDLDRATFAALGQGIQGLPGAVETPSGPYRFFGTDTHVGPYATVAEESYGLFVEGLLEPRDHVALRAALADLIERSDPSAHQV
ncbi:MAG: hypothetical protein KF901_17825 [Myxococcales bacterium]|nr:hypothetical protein [Myxococcales bacterium]